MNWWQTILGLLLIAGGIACIKLWWDLFVTVVKGSIGAFIAMIGLMFFLIGITE